MTSKSTLVEKEEPTGNHQGAEKRYGGMRRGEEETVIVDFHVC